MYNLSRYCDLHFKILEYSKHYNETTVVWNKDKQCSGYEFNMLLMESVAIQIQTMCEQYQPL